MLSVPSAVRIYLCREPTDMRRSFDGLAMIVQCIIKHDPLSGHVFVFRNKRGNMLKLLYWDRDGYAIWYKRLEKGSFKRPTAHIDALNSELSQEDLYFILRGIDFEKTKKRKRYLPTKCTV